MFDVGFQELVLLFVIGLLVLGPQKLPKVAAEIGKWVGRARRTATQLRRQLEREIELSEIQPPKEPPVPPPSPPQAETPPAATQNPEHHISDAVSDPVPGTPPVADAGATSVPAEQTSANEPPPDKSANP